MRVAGKARHVQLRKDVQLKRASQDRVRFNEIVEVITYADRGSDESVLASEGGTETGASDVYRDDDGGADWPRHSWDSRDDESYESEWEEDRRLKIEELHRKRQGPNDEGARRRNEDRWGHSLQQEQRDEQTWGAWATLPALVESTSRVSIDDYGDPSPPGSSSSRSTYGTARGAPIVAAAIASAKPPRRFSSDSFPRRRSPMQDVMTRRPRPARRNSWRNYSVTPMGDEDQDRDSPHPSRRMQTARHFRKRTLKSVIKLFYDHVLSSRLFSRACGNPCRSKFFICGCVGTGIMSKGSFTISNEPSMSGPVWQSPASFNISQEINAFRMPSSHFDVDSESSLERSGLYSPEPGSPFLSPIVRSEEYDYSGVIPLSASSLGDPLASITFTERTLPSLSAALSNHDGVSPTLQWPLTMKPIKEEDELSPDRPDSSRLSLARQGDAESSGSPVKPKEASKSIGAEASQFLSPRETSPKFSSAFLDASFNSSYSQDLSSTTMSSLGISPAFLSPLDSSGDIERSYVNISGTRQSRMPDGRQKSSTALPSLPFSELSMSQDNLDSRNSKAQFFSAHEGNEAGGMFPQSGGPQLTQYPPTTAPAGLGGLPEVSQKVQMSRWSQEVKRGNVEADEGPSPRNSGTLWLEDSGVVHSDSGELKWRLRERAKVTGFGGGEYNGHLGQSGTDWQKGMRGRVVDELPHSKVILPQRLAELLVSRSTTLKVERREFQRKHFGPAAGPPGSHWTRHAMSQSVDNQTLENWNADADFYDRRRQVQQPEERRWVIDMMQHDSSPEDPELWEDEEEEDEEEEDTEVKRAQERGFPAGHSSRAQEKHHIAAADESYHQWRHGSLTRSTTLQLEKGPQSRLREENSGTEMVNSRHMNSAPESSRVASTSKSALVRHSTQTNLALNQPPAHHPQRLSAARALRRQLPHGIHGSALPGPSTRASLKTITTSTDWTVARPLANMNFKFRHGSPVRDLFAFPLDLSLQKSEQIQGT